MPRQLLGDPHLDAKRSSSATKPSSAETPIFGKTFSMVPIHHRHTRFSTIIAAFLFAPTLLIQMQSCNYGTIDLDVQGHRGCRGLMPENTVPAFMKAWALGVTTLELDVVVSRDSQLVVSHEPWFSHAFCLTPQGEPITEANEKNHNIFAMDYSEIAAWDCGSKGNPAFPDQQRFVAHKPLLSEVFDSVESVATHSDDEDARLPRYNIELKMEPGGTGVFNPPAKQFVHLILNVLREGGLLDRCT